MASEATNSTDSPTVPSLHKLFLLTILVHT